MASAARRLTEAFESSEADSDVLAEGYDIEHYMKTIFRQLFGYSPEIANGLRDSLTKKRFKMMTTKTSGRHSLLRLAGTLPAVIGPVRFSLTTRAAEVRILQRPPASRLTKWCVPWTRRDKKVSNCLLQNAVKPLPGRNRADQRIERRNRDRQGGHGTDFSGPRQRTSDNLLCAWKRRKPRLR